MTRITCIITAALAALVIVAPVATAMPSRGEVGTSGPAGTTSSPQQDRRSPDARDASATPRTGTRVPGKDVRSPDARDAGTTAIEPAPGVPTWPVNPEPIAPAPVDAIPLTGGDGTSPLVYSLPGVILSVLLAAGMGYVVRTSMRARRARIGA